MNNEFIRLEKEFHKNFESSSPLNFFFAPGRVNLIGEHIDYSGGVVMPSTIEFGTYAVATSNNENKVRLVSLNASNKVEFNLDDLKYKKDDLWGNYPKGIFNEYSKLIKLDKGIDILYWGNIPGGGLSSSASIELCTAVIIQNFYNYFLNSDEIQNKKDMAKLCQKSENEFNGVKCGIMDQAIIALGKEGRAILLDCSTLDFSYVKVSLADYSFVIANTNKPRSLITSKYNERISEIAEILEILNREKEVKNLCELKVDELDWALSIIKKPNLIKRTRHSILENKRVYDAAKALDENNLETFGRLLIESHNSLRDDYEVTGKELDSLVSLMLKCDGVLGARMTGAGFGGCSVALVHNDSIKELIDKVTPLYDKEIGYKPDFYVTKPVHGAKAVTV